MREYVIQLTGVATYESFVDAFNAGLCHHCEGHWNGRSWDAFNDYLAWPNEDRYRLVFAGWGECTGLEAADRKMIEGIVGDSEHVDVVFD